MRLPLLLITLLSLSCNSPRYNHGLKDSDFKPSYKQEALDILDYIELEKYLNSI